MLPVVPASGDVNLIPGNLMRAFGRDDYLALPEEVLGTREGNSVFNYTPCGITHRYNMEIRSEGDLLIPCHRDGGIADFVPFYLV